MPASSGYPATTQSVQSVYRSAFVKATTRHWFEDVINMDEVIPVVRDLMGKMNFPLASLNSRMRTIQTAIDQTHMAIDFYDMVRLLRHCFYGVAGSPASLIVKAAIRRMSEAWPLTLTPDTLRLAKGLAQHMADGVEPKNISEYELACLLLRPSISPGLEVVHAASGVFGTVLEAPAPDTIDWRPFGQSGRRCEPDKYAIIPLVPLLSGIPLDSTSPFPTVPAAAIVQEFDEVMAC